MRRQNIRTLALIVVTFTYLLVGAAIFDVIESGYEREKRQIYLNEEEDWKLKYNISTADFEEISELVIKLKPYKASSEQWKFAGAFYFSTTLITTIGYGHSTPKTRAGKMVCMLYSLIGIPLCIVMFQSIGERLNALITCILRALKRLFRCKNTEVSQMNLIVVSMNICTLVLAAGAALFSYYETWDYLDSVYYCFITLTTVGFGDMVALQKNDQLKSKPDYVLFSLVFIMAGLTVVSSAMNLMVLRFLTMNTEDVRREELEQAAAAREAIRLEGDVITANGSVLSTHDPEAGIGYSEEAGAAAAAPDHQRQRRRKRRQQRGRPTDGEDPPETSACASCCGGCFGGGGGGNADATDAAWLGGRRGGPGSSRLKRPAGRYTVARRPGKIQHLLFPQSSSSFRRAASAAAAAAGGAATLHHQLQLQQQRQQQQQQQQEQRQRHPLLAAASLMAKRASI